MNTKYLIEEQTLRSIADSIRNKEGSEDTIAVDEYSKRIHDIEIEPSEYLLLSAYIDNYPTFCSDLVVTEEDTHIIEAFIAQYSKEREVEYEK